MQYETEYIFELASNNGTISILKYESPTLKEKSLVLKTEINACKRVEGLTLTLASGEVLSFKNSEITCEKLQDGKSKLKSTLLLTSELYEKLSKSDLVHFNIGTFDVPVKFKEEGEDFKGLFVFAKQ